MVQPFSYDRDMFPQSRDLAQSLIDSLGWCVPITGAGTLTNGDDVFTVGGGDLMRKPEFIDHLAQFTAAQQCALVRIFCRHIRDTDHPLYKGVGFVDWVARDCYVLHFDGCAMANVPHMTIGIERDGTRTLTRRSFDRSTAKRGVLFVGLVLYANATNRWRNIGAKTDEH